MNRRSLAVAVQHMCNLLVGAGALLGPILTQAQPAQDWPNRAVHIVVPYAAGNAVDALARVIARKAAQLTEQSFVIENRGGASGSLGSAAVAKAPADGYTLLFATSSTHAIAPYLPASFGVKLPYDVVRDFTPIAHMSDNPMALLASNALPANNIAELIALAHAQPGRINYAHSGNGTITHLSGELLRQQAEIDITHVPYSSAAIAADLIANHVQLRFDALPAALAQIQSGKVRALAISSLRRSPTVPNLPTLDESGLPGFSAVPWFGLFGPKDMDPALVERINAVFTQAQQSPDLAQRMEELGAQPWFGSPSEFAEFVAQDRSRWEQLIRKIDGWQE